MDLPVEPELINDDAVASKGAFKAYVTSAAGGSGANASNSNNNNNGGDDGVEDKCACCGAEHSNCCDFCTSDADELEFYRDFFDDDTCCDVSTQPYSFSLNDDLSSTLQHGTCALDLQNVNNNAATRDDEETPSVGQEAGMVTLMVYGSDDVAGPLELNNGDRDMFAPGKQDEFDVRQMCTVVNKHVSVGC